METSAEAKFNVGGILLDRPFKIRRLGHFGFNLVKMDEGVRFYVDLLGFRVSDVMDYSRRAKSPDQVAGLGDPNGYFTRYGTDHHAMVLFPKRVREALGRHEKPGVTINQITWQVGSLWDVGEGIKWFQEKNIKIQRSGRDMPGSNWHNRGRCMIAASMSRHRSLRSRSSTRSSRRLRTGSTFSRATGTSTSSPPLMTSTASCYPGLSRSCASDR